MIINTRPEKQARRLGYKIEQAELNYLNIPMNSPLLQKIGLFLCAQRGPTMGGHPPSRMKSLNFSKNFMIKNLLD